MLTCACSSIIIETKPSIALTGVRPHVIDADLFTVIGRIQIAFIVVCNVKIMDSAEEFSLAFTFTCVSIAIDSISSSATTCVASNCVLADLIAYSASHQAFINI